ncbi:MAG: inositol monophosphatase family protein [Candidatus Krumholzibacteriia bacterium]
MSGPWNESLHRRLLDGVRAVGDYQLEHYGALAPASLRTKSGHSDLVTAVDTESESRLAALLHALLPEAAQLGEEGLRRPGAGELTWIVDPLDGTTNYAHEHPFFCISVALVRGREPVLGVIHAPRLGETFHGWGGRAWADDAPLAVSARRSPETGLFATGFADRRQGNGRADVNLGNLERILHASRGVRRAGSAALDLAFTAAGRLDGFWEMGLNPWDVAAGIYLVRAAGGRVTDFRGAEDALAGDQIVASSGRVHDWMLGLLELAPAFDRAPAALFGGA